MSLKKPAVLITAGAIALAACTDVNTPTTNPNQRQQEGAAVGAISGALIGIMRGDNKAERQRGAVVGAIVGGVAGSAIGAQLDKQAAELQASISNDRVQIINTGSELIVRMPQDILFDFDSTAIKSSLRSDLGALAANLQRYPGSLVDITGHTDNVGTAEYNRDLSYRRANSVAAVLISNGVSAGRIRTIGMGEDQPIATNLTAEGRALNRRVDIVIRPTN